MTNPNRGEMLITLGEKTWNSRVTMDGLARIEAFCGYGIIKILGKLTEGDLTTTEICGIIHPIVKGGGNDVSMKDIQKAVWDAGLADAMRVCGEVLASALNAGQDEGNEATA